jgi:hypothetical protein
MRIPAQFVTALTVTRYAAGDWVDGRYLDASTATVTAQASVQPIRGRELLMLPEGWRTREPVQVYTETELLTVDEAAGTKPDQFAFGGRTYEVHRVEAWPYHGTTHYEAVALKVDET